MQFLRFMRRDKEERKAPAAPSAPQPVKQTIAVLKREPAPVAAAPQMHTATVMAPSAPPLDLERIRRELAEIAKIVGSDDAQATHAGAARTGSSVDMKLSEVVKLCADAFIDVNALRTTDTMITVEVPELYDQLAKGKVQTTVSNLLADIPANYLSDYASAHAEDKVSLPLHVVVASVEPSELRKRTAFVERDLGDKLLPNLFTPGALVAPAAPEAEAPAPVPAPSAPTQDLPPALAARLENDVLAGPPAADADEPHVFEIGDEQVPSEALAEDPPAAPVPEEPAAAPANEPVIEPVAQVPAPAPEVAAVEEPVVAESVAEQVPAVVEIPDEPAQSIHEEPVSTVVHAAPEETAAPPVENVAADPGVEADPADPDVVVTDVAASDTAPAAPGGLIDMEAIPMPAGDQPRVLIGGIDVNYATAEELSARLNGVGLRLAQRIVEERLAQGPFKDVYDLARVPGLRNKRFEMVTGVKWSSAYFNYRSLVDQLGGSFGNMPDVKKLAAGFAELNGFVGSIIIHEDGLVLAGSWKHPAADALGAFAPQMFKKINKYVKQLQLGDIRSISFVADHQPITVVRSGQIYFAALHDGESFSKKGVDIVQAVATELSRRLAA